MSPLADPDAAAAYNRARWRSHGRLYRASRQAPLTPMSLGQALDEDRRQAEALAALEARHIGRAMAQQRLASWLVAERRWMRIMWSPTDTRERDAGD